MVAVPSHEGLQVHSGKLRVWPMAETIPQGEPELLGQAGCTRIAAEAAAMKERIAANCILTVERGFFMYWKDCRLWVIDEKKIKGETLLL